MSIPFLLPPVREGGVAPSWNGEGFHVGDECVSVLEYSINHLGWNDELTEFHEESAGDHHFIDRASRDHAISQLTKHVRTAQPVILEVGCSSGFMLKRMQQQFPGAILIGADVVQAPLKKLSQTLKNIPLMRFDMQRCPLPDNSVDALVMLNVLEHIEDDRAVISQAHRILKPGGVLVIEVPAGPHLYDCYDKVLMHYRRYRLSELTRMIQAEGFHLAKKSHLGFFIYPGFRHIKLRNKRLLTESDARQRQHVENVIQKTGENKLLHALMQAELGIGRWFSYPTGIRCLVTSIKR
jgi:ubiquinone/menaquinone biosynthesis C-methylase UbiE